MITVGENTQDEKCFQRSVEKIVKKNFEMSKQCFYLHNRNYEF